MKIKKAFTLIEIALVLATISILLLGVIQGSKLVDKAKLANAKKLTDQSPVKNISGLTFWFESTLDDAFLSNNNSYLLKNGDAILAWNDANEQLNKKFISQADVAKQPTYITNAINGLPALLFDGVDDQLERSTTFGIDLTTGKSIAIFAVINNKAASSSLIWWSSGSTRINIHPDSTLRFDYGTCCTENVGRFSAVMSSNFIGSSHILTAIKKIDNTAEIILDGSSINSGAMTSTISTSANSTFYIGSAGTNYFIKGYIGEIIIFNRSLNDEERKNIELYLSKKWGIALQ